MNNNMPNNFNNGMPNGGGNPMEQAAKEQLVGGQSAVGSGPSVMQGVPGAQNGPGVMQGMPGVQNGPGVMQGNPAPKPAPAPAMPGQGNSGINAMTMQKEEVKKDSPEVVSIPNFASNMPEPPAAPQPGVVQTPNPMPGPAPAPNQIGNPTNPLNNTMNMPNVNEPKLPMGPQTPNTIGGNNIIGNPTPNSIGQVNNQNLNGIPSDNNINQMNKPQSTIGVIPPAPGNSAPKDLNDTMPSINTSSIGSTSQIGASDTSTTLNNDVVEMPDMPQKKFPLSTREMVLIGIALVGIVAVVIMYWPRG
ncbi:MAG: hypothetical protein IJL74_02085 [Bacilli bacterium]|nr:hypothetical protein [Bacilli bacterium]